MAKWTFTYEDSANGVYWTVYPLPCPNTDTVYHVKGRWYSSVQDITEMYCTVQYINEFYVTVQYYNSTCTVVFSTVLWWALPVMVCGGVCPSWQPGKTEISTLLYVLYSVVYCFALLYTVVHCCTLVYPFVHCCTLVYTVVHYTVVHCCTLHCCTLVYTVVHCFTLLYTVVHCCTLYLYRDKRRDIWWNIAWA